MVGIAVIVLTLGVTVPFRCTKRAGGQSRCTARLTHTARSKFKLAKNKCGVCMQQPVRGDVIMVPTMPPDERGKLLHATINGVERLLYPGGRKRGLSTGRRRRRRRGS